MRTVPGVEVPGVEVPGGRLVRHGDVLFIPHNTAVRPQYGYAINVTPIPNGVLALGEVTDHAHRVETLEQAEVFSVWGDKYVQVGPLGVRIVHEDIRTGAPADHKPVALKADTLYKVRQPREWDYLAETTRRVVD